MLPEHSISPQRAVKKSPVIPPGMERESFETLSFTSNLKKPSHTSKVFEMVNGCIYGLSFLTKVVMKSELEFIVHCHYLKHRFRCTEIYNFFLVYKYDLEFHLKSVIDSVSYFSSYYFFQIIIDRFMISLG